MSRGDLLTLAEHRHGDPHRAAQEADRALATAGLEDDCRSLAHWVRGLARHELGETRAAIADLERARAIAAAADFPEGEARACANLAISLLQVGETSASARALRRALAIPAGPARGLVHYLAALHHQRRGRHRDALDGYAAALPELLAAGDLATVAGLHLNRGVVLAYRNDVDGAAAAFALAEEVARERGLDLLAAMAAHNLGFAVGRLGQVPAALDALERARRCYEATPSAPRQLAVLHSDRAEVLLGGGLLAEARRAADAAITALSAAGNVADLHEARVLLARICLHSGDLPAALEAAALAEEGFAGTDRTAWAALARSVGLQAELRAALDPAGAPLDSAAHGAPAHAAAAHAALLARCTALAEQLAAAGWPVEAIDAHGWAARLAVRSGDLERAGAELRAMGRGSPRAPLTRSNRCLAVAELAAARGDLPAAQRSLAAGVRAVDVHRSRLGASHARAEAAQLGIELARSGLRNALRDGRTDAIFRWSERSRATALQFPPVPAPAGSALAQQLERLRRAHVDAPAGAVARSGAEAARAIEAAIVEGMLHLRADVAPPPAPAPLPAVRAALAGATLVAYLELDGLLHAVVVGTRRARRVALGPTDAVTAALDHFGLAVQRLLLRGPAHVERALGAMERAAAELDRLLVLPLGALAPRVVVVPAGSLHAVAWSALPSLRGRAVGVAPSAALWLRARGLDRPGPVPVGRALLVAGPGLPGAAAEIDALAGQYRGATVLRGPQATAAAVLAAMERADLVHLAAHGTFRSDSPMFSSLTLADGPLTVYDLERLTAVPATVVLTACNAGAAHVTAGDQLLGTTAALVHLGVANVVAPVAPVPDGMVAGFAVDLHRALLAGDGVAAALRRAREQAATGMAAACAAWFSVVGAG